MCTESHSTFLTLKLIPSTAICLPFQARSQGHPVLSSVLGKASYKEGAQISYYLGTDRKHNPECDSFKHTCSSESLTLPSHYLGKATAKPCVSWLGWLQDKEEENPTQTQLRKHLCCYHSGIFNLLWGCLSHKKFSFFSLTWSIFPSHNSQH